MLDVEDEEKDSTWSKKQRRPKKIFGHHRPDTIDQALDALMMHRNRSAATVA